MKRIFIFAFVALCGCSNFSAAQSSQLSHPANFEGSYFNQGQDYKSDLYLNDDGKGAILSRNNDGTFKQLMTFKWGVGDGQFYMMDIYFTKDKKRIIKAFSDSHTAYSFSGSLLRSRGPSGEWIAWQRTGNRPDMSIIAAISHD